MKTLTWKPFGPVHDSAAAVPPTPKKMHDYVLAYDDTLGKIVYAVAHDYHQFGHAWSFDGRAFTPLSTNAFRLGSQQQAWAGTYDPARKCVVGWSFDGYDPATPVGVGVGD